MLLFLVASGLSLIFGLMGIVNFAHGSFYALGGYFAISFLARIESFWIALLVAPLAVMVVGIVIERLLISRLYDEEPLYQVLLTFGLAIFFEAFFPLRWGENAISVSPPGQLTGTIAIGEIGYPKYRLFVIGAGVIIAVFLGVLLQRTRLGIIVRAGTLDSEMVKIMGIDINRIFTLMFAIGVGLAAIGGIFFAPLTSVYPTMGLGVLIEAFVVVIVGGLGNIRGSFVGALIIGFSQAIGSFYFDKYVGFVMFLLMIVVLTIRPHGLFGEPGYLEH